ncbi:MAG: hypothetical protein JWM95_1868, partial [Gemmatimonadetes bacterium]|nr:hypothetical protein [Gemmatimonadota bacterium]
ASRREKPVDTAAAALRLSVAKPESTTTAQREAVKLAADAAQEDSSGTTPFVATLPAPPAKPFAPLPRAIPDVHGLSVRQAVHALHANGFRVQLMTGPSGTTSPAAGLSAAAGSLVRLAGTP